MKKKKTKRKQKLKTKLPKSAKLPEPILPQYKIVMMPEGGLTTNVIMDGRGSYVAINGIMLHADKEVKGVLRRLNKGFKDRGPFIVIRLAQVVEG